MRHGKAPATLMGTETHTPTECRHPAWPHQISTTASMWSCSTKHISIHETAVCLPLCKALNAYCSYVIISRSITSMVLNQNLCGSKAVCFNVLHLNFDVMEYIHFGSSLDIYSFLQSFPHLSQCRFYCFKTLSTHISHILWEPKCSLLHCFRTECI